MELSFFHPYADWGLLALRIALGAIFIIHGLPKLKHAAAMGSGMGLPGWFVWLLGIAELVGGILVLIGFASELGGLILALVMLGALYFKLMVWKAPFTSMEKLGWEFDLMLLAAALVVLTAGAGGISVDGSMA